MSLFFHPLHIINVMREQNKIALPTDLPASYSGAPYVPFLLPLTVQRIGTTLIFTKVISGRHQNENKPRLVRVLPLPANCFHATLQRAWDNSFGPEADDDLVMWWPCDPANPPPPSDN